MHTIKCLYYGDKLGMHQQNGNTSTTEMFHNSVHKIKYYTVDTH